MVDPSLLGTRMTELAQRLADSRITFCDFMWSTGLFLGCDADMEKALSQQQILAYTEQTCQ